MKHSDPSFDGFPSALINWQKKFGRQGLPWMDKNPYHRWLSEVMLQQTQVSVVCDYFVRFIKTFPTLKDLALADEDSVMRLWAGLGYYSRARNLLACAKTIWRDYSGTFPTSVEELVKLPGIGRSTAGAIASFSFDIGAPILDGNVKRVFSRLFAIADPIEASATQKKLWILAEKLVPEKEAGIYNQALMDIGAGICIKSNPRCRTCPVHFWCKATKQGNPMDYPVRKKKSVKPTKKTALLLYLYSEKIWIVNRPEKGVWQSLWSLPETQAAQGKFITAFKHEFSHYRLEASVYAIRLETPTPPTAHGKWSDWDNVFQEALPAPIKRVLLVLRDAVQC